MRSLCVVFFISFGNLYDHRYEVFNGSSERATRTDFHDFFYWVTRLNLDRNFALQIIIALLPDIRKKINARTN